MKAKYFAFIILTHKENVCSVNGDLVKEIADDIEHLEPVYNLFKNSLSGWGISRLLIYHFKIGENVDATFGSGHFTAKITDNQSGVYSAIITSHWTGDAWSMIFTSYDATNYIKKLS